jgi:hypothetical protein
MRLFKSIRQSSFINVQKKKGIAGGGVDDGAGARGGIGEVLRVNLSKSDLRHDPTEKSLGSELSAADQFDIVLSKKIADPGPWFGAVHRSDERTAGQSTVVTKGQRYRPSPQPTIDELTRLGHDIQLEVQDFQRQIRDTIFTTFEHLIPP